MANLRRQIAHWSRTAVLLACSMFFGTAQAEHLRFASTRSLSNAPFLIAQAKGYFAAEGIDAEHVIFDASGPITVAVASGDADFGATGLSGAFFNLASSGRLHIIAGYVTDSPGFPAIAYIVSNHAWEDGLKSFKDLGGHSVGVTQMGTGLQYSVALLAEKFGFDFHSIRILPLQSYPNELSAVTGGTIEAAVVPTAYARPAVESGTVKLIGELGDAVRVQTGTIFVSAKTAGDRPRLVERFLRAFRHGARDYHDAFVSEDDHPAWTASAPALAELLAAAVLPPQPVEQLRHDLTYVDADARVNAGDILRQAAWYKAQGMVKGEIDGDTLIDRRFAILFPER